MKILYDTQIFNLQKFGGISRYFYELMMHSKDLFEYNIPYTFSENIYGKQLRQYKNFPLKFHFKGKRRIINIFDRAEIKKNLRNNYDIIHPTYYDPCLLKDIINIPMVIDVHDMIYEKMPEYFKKNDKTAANKKKYFIKASAIIATSQRTKNDLLEIHPEIPEKKVNVIYHGEIFSEYKQKSEKQNYILFTGQRKIYKNFNKFIEAVAPLLIRYDLQLICTGPEFTKNEYTLLSQLKIAEKTKAVFASESALQDFYAKALMFVFPSLYEGFGFPILEAFASGCPALISGTSCFPEIAADAAVYFDPYSVDDMREKIEKVLLDSSLQAKLIERGFERVKYFSWEKTVKQTYQLYCEVLSHTTKHGL
jgi:glycosyltransferase involved in cell wall biosynthesis